MQRTPGINERVAYFRSLELEQTRKQLERTEAEFDDLNQLYGDLMESEAFLYAVVAPEGTVLIMNMGMKIFLGHDMQFQSQEDIPETSIFEFCLFSQMEALKGLLRDALVTPVAALVPLVRRNYTQVWMDVEFAPTIKDGCDAIQITGKDVSDWMRSQTNAGKSDSDSEPQAQISTSNAGATQQGQQVRIERRSEKWPNILDSCPGLLCCVIDHSGRLLYASQGYCAIAMRLLNHDCAIGMPYPPQRSKTDRALHALLSGVMLGGTDGIEVTERRALSNEETIITGFESDDDDEVITWNFTASPLRIENVISGAVLYVSRNVTSVISPDDAEKAVTGDMPSSLVSPSAVSLLDALSVGAAVVNAQGFCLAANPAFAGSFAKDVSDIIGQRLLDLIQKDAANEEFHKNFLVTLKYTLALEDTSETPSSIDPLIARVADQHGELKWLDVSLKPLKWDDKDAALLTCADVTELHRTREQLKRALEVDRTTGILNRQGMERLLTQEVERVIRESKSLVADTRPLSLIIIDIDGFRRINADHGYAATDHVLKALTEALRSMLNLPVSPVSPISSVSPATRSDTDFTTDVIGRWGGDEFMVLTRRSESAALALANSLRERMNASFNNANAELSMTLSIGIAEFRSETGMDIEGFIAAAFDAMIKAKRSGGNRTMVSGKTEMSEI